MYIVLLKDAVAVATGRCNNLEEISENMTPFDKAVEVSESVFNSIVLPAVFVNGKWEKADKSPKVEYPPTQKTNAGENSVYDELAAAYREGVQEA